MRRPNNCSGAAASSCSTPVPSSSTCPISPTAGHTAKPSLNTANRLWRAQNSCLNGVSGTPVEKTVSLKYGLSSLPSSTKRLIRSSYIDITERKRIEADLKESEERYRTIVEQDYRSILENMQDIFYRTDRKGNLILVSPSGAALLGYAGTEEMLGRPATDYYADPAQREAILAALKKNQSVSNMEVTLKRRDGTPVTVSTSSHVYKDASGNYAGVEGIFRDITHLKQVQEELRQSEEQNRVLIEHTQDGAFIMQDGLLRFCNGAFAAMIGYTPGEIIGTPVPNLIAPEDREMVMGRQQDRLLGKSLPESYEFRMLHKDAITRVLVILSVGIGTYRDRPAVIGTVRDVTREREREHALLESEGKYRSLVETSFDGIIIHQDGVFVYANRAAVRLLGPDLLMTIMGKPILSFVHPEFRTVVLPADGICDCRNTACDQGEVPP